MSLDTMARVLPDLEPNRELMLPPSVERTLANGLTIIAIERRSVPLVELRLRIPFSTTRLDPVFLAQASLLSQTIFSGTVTKSTVDIAAALQTVGGALGVGLDQDRLLVSGNALASGLDAMLGMLAEVLTEATFPVAEVETEQARLVDRIQVALSQPSHLVRVALLRRVYGDHPYALQTAEIADLSAVTRDEVAQLHAQRVGPAGATLVLVGDFDPEAALDAASAALGDWAGATQPEPVPAAPAIQAGPLVLVDRPGSVQSSLRLVLPAVGRTHRDHAALTLANLVLGGYFSSRWVENIREEKGYSYSPHSRIDHSVAGSSVTLSAEVGTDTTAPALLETLYELGRLATVVPARDEIEQARQYAMGSLLLGMSTQSGLASLASTYAGFGLRLGFLADHAARLAGATEDDIAAAAAAYLAPAKAVSVVLGDAEQVEAALTTLTPVERIGA